MYRVTNWPVFVGSDVLTTSSAFVPKTPPGRLRRRAKRNSISVRGLSLIPRQTAKDFAAIKKQDFLQAALRFLRAYILTARTGK